MLEVTAKNEKGEEIFSDEHVYEMIGLDAEGKRSDSVVWIVKDDISKVLQPGIDSRSFKIEIPQGTGSIEIKASMYYQIDPTAQPIPMVQVSEKLVVK